jgi:hypothetical protein
MAENKNRKALRSPQKKANAAARVVRNKNTRARRAKRHSDRNMTKFLAGGLGDTDRAHFAKAHAEELHKLTLKK